MSALAGSCNPEAELGTELMHSAVVYRCLSWGLNQQTSPSPIIATEIIKLITYHTGREEAIFDHSTTRIWKTGTHNMLKRLPVGAASQREASSEPQSLKETVKEESQGQGGETGQAAWCSVCRLQMGKSWCVLEELEGDKSY